MKVCCVDLSIAARMVGFYGLVIGAVVTVEMSNEIGRASCMIEAMTTAMDRGELFVRGEEMSSNAAMSSWLLGLSLEEFGSRMRHAMHSGGELPPHVHVHDRTQPSQEKRPLEPSRQNQTTELYAMEAEIQIYIGFLFFAIVYALASAMVVYGSVAETQWTCVPWLVAHLAAVSAQTASLVVQVTAVIATVPEHDQLAPGNPDEAHHHDDDQGGSSAPRALIMSSVNLLFLVYFWIVVIVAVRSWRKPNHLVMTTKAAKGDESFALSSLGSQTYSVSYY